ncbi:hypothetical protein TorRG33x02_178290 [Trema orientale]|uniref:Aspartic peptidase domain containing protein n=1 Tax=Trema orientale TaxID=63057 RepID=A0A2P5ELD9_TREOI|nr:hypothetical protein TorRG33x02_178290 [Trema orientale]
MGFTLVLNDVVKPSVFFVALKNPLFRVKFDSQAVKLFCLVVVFSSRYKLNTRGEDLVVNFPDTIHTQSNTSQTPHKLKQETLAPVATQNQINSQGLHQISRGTKHKSSDCPLRRFVNIAEEAPDEDTPDLPEVELVECDTCKVCEVIVDSGSSENVIFKGLVCALGFTTKKYPKPYKVGWMKKGSEIHVTEYCPVSFSTGKSYKDEAMYDVLEMDVSHLLLGRP